VRRGQQFYVKFYVSPFKSILPERRAVTIRYKVRPCSLDGFWLADADLLWEKNIVKCLADKIKRIGCYMLAH
jgi:hypothetical protein